MIFFYKILIFFILFLNSIISFAQCPPTAAAFNLNPANGCSLPHTVFFTDQSVLPDTWSWDFGDGNTSTLQNPVHNYITTGTFVVSLIVTDTIFGCRDTVYDTVRVSLPTADFNGNPLFGCAPVATSFTDLSVANSSSITGWSWNFGDGNTSTLQNPTHIYTTPGIYTVTLTVTDSIGCTNTETKTNYVQVLGPQVKFGPDTVAGFCPGTTVNFTDSTLFGSPITSWAWDFGDGGTSPLQNPTYTYNNQGTFTVTLIVTDLDGCRDTFLINNLVNIHDTIPPTITCPANQNVFYDANCLFSLADYTSMAVANDNCGVVNVTQFPGVGSSFSSTANVTLTATDAAGNTSSCSFNVIPTDSTSPTITCPPDQNVFFNASCQYTLIDYTTVAVFSDNCGGVNVAQFPGAGSIFSSSTPVTITVTDAAGNTSNCTFNVIPSDTTSPTITCPPDQNVFYDANCLFILADYTSVAVANDNCSNVNVTQFPGAGSSFSATASVTLTATDAAGNTSSCSFNVIPTDSTAPTITCPVDQQVVVDANCQFVLPDFTSMVVASDNCGTVNLTQNPAAGILLSGIQIITITADDGNGNTSTCTFNALGNDTTSPTVNCPSNITSCTPNVTFATPTGADNCGIASVVQTAGLSSGSSFPVGVTTNTFEVTDFNGNTATCSFDVEVLPFPTITDLVTDVTCNGLSDGSIDISVAGGTTPFNYNWSNSAITEDISSLTAGTYTIIVTDSNNCADTLDVIVNEPQPLVINEVVTNISCFGAGDGSVSTNVSGGTSPYSYSWSTGGTGTSINGLAAGSYTLTVTDSNNCTLNGLYTIIEPGELTATYTVSEYGNYNVSGIGACDGSINLSASGGTGMLTYNWSSGHNGTSLFGLCAGTYTVDITDANGCSITLDIVLTEPPPINIPSGFSPNGDGINDVFYIEGLDFYEENTLIVFNRWGNITFKASPYLSDWDGSSGKSLIGKKAPDGSYFYKLKLPGGETKTGYVILKR